MRIRASCCWLFFAASAAAAAPKFFGPTELQDSFLPSQLRYQSYPEVATVLPKGAWSANVTVDWTADLAQTATYLFDGESVTTKLKVRYAPIERWEFGFDLPYCRRIDGVADAFIEFVETFLNAKVDARYALPRDTYNAYIAGPGGTAMTLKKAQDFQDLTLRAKYQLLYAEPGRFDLAAVATMSFPTGGNTFGGDGFSPGLGLHAQKPLKHFNFFGGAAGNYYTDNREQKYAFNHWRAMTYGGVEWKPFFWGALAFTYQMYTPFAYSNNPLDALAHYYSVAGRFWLYKRVAFEAGVVENLGLIENRNSSDVTFKFSLSAHF